MLTDGVVMLGPWAVSDAEWLCATCQDPEIQRWTLVPSPYRLDHAREFVEVIAPGAWAAASGVHLAITDADSSVPLGAIGMTVLDAVSGVAELGYYLAPEARGAGAATRALELFGSWAIDVLDLVRLELHVFAGNTASASVAGRCGFQLEGTMRQRELRHGTRHDVDLFARLRA